MPAKDIFHELVREALEKEGWVVTDDPYYLKTPLLKDGLYIDLAAEKLLAAEKDSQKIVVEIKSFLNESLIHDFHAALGQLLSYQINLDIQEPERILYLGMPLYAFDRMQKQPFYEIAFDKYNIHLLVVNTQNQSIIWHR